jgi:hypothetical protein
VSGYPMHSYWYPCHHLTLFPAVCAAQSVVEDRWPFHTALPPLLQYPVADSAFPFVAALVAMFYSPGAAGGWGTWGRWDGDKVLPLSLPLLVRPAGDFPARTFSALLRPRQVTCPAVGVAGQVKGLWQVVSCFLGRGGKRADAGKLDGKKST